MMITFAKLPELDIVLIPRNPIELSVILVISDIMLSTEFVSQSVLNTVHIVMSITISVYNATMELN